MFVSIPAQRGPKWGVNLDSFFAKQKACNKHPLEGLDGKSLLVKTKLALERKPPLVWKAAAKGAWAHRQTHKNPRGTSTGPWNMSHCITRFFGYDVAPYPFMNAWHSPRAAKVLIPRHLPRLVVPSPCCLGQPPATNMVAVGHVTRYQK